MVFANARSSNSWLCNPAFLLHSIVLLVCLHTMCLLVHTTQLSSEASSSTKSPNIITIIETHVQAVTNGAAQKEKSCSSEVKVPVLVIAFIIYLNHAYSELLLFGMANYTRFIFNYCTIYHLSLLD